MDIEQFILTGALSALTLADAKGECVVCDLMITRSAFSDCTLFICNSALGLCAANKVVAYQRGVYTLTPLGVKTTN